MTPEDRNAIIASANRVLGAALLDRVMTTSIPLPGGVRPTINRAMTLLGLPRQQPHGIVVYGPRGCGKSRNAEKIAKFLGMPIIHDEGKGIPGDFAHMHDASKVAKNTLVLTDRDGIVGAFHFDLITVIMAAAGHPLDLG